MSQWLKLDPKEKFLSLFLLKGIIFFVIWTVFYDNWLINTSFVDKTLINHLVIVNKKILTFLGYTVFYNAQTVGIDGSHGVFIGAPCNGMSLFALFTGFIVAFTGKIKYKIPFIVLGVLVIHVLNILRILVLTLLAKFAPQTLDFNHKYTFTIILYGIIFLMWMYWVKRYANKK